MKKPKPAKTKTSKDYYKPVAYAFLGLFVVLVIVFLARGWIRKNGLPMMVGTLHSGKIQALTDSHITTLQNPLQELGFTTIDRKPTQCVMARASKLSAEVDCTAAYYAYTEVSAASAPADELVQRAGVVRQRLLNSGWTEGNTPLDKTIESATTGDGSQPDAYYEKNDGNIRCVFDTNTAFALPGPRAYASRLFCSRTVDILGNPW